MNTGCIHREEAKRAKIFKKQEENLQAFYANFPNLGVFLLILCDLGGEKGFCNKVVGFYRKSPRVWTNNLPVCLDRDMIPRMTVIDETNQSPAEILCKSCGLCCTGHLFIWVKLRPAELDPAEALGMRVFRDDPTQRGFSQPCPLWLGQCTIYASRHYPRACRAYNCKLLKEVLAENTPLPAALTAVEQAKGVIREMEALLPASSNANFRERFVAHFEKSADAEFRRKADALLAFYENVFDVKDLLD